MTTNPKKKKVLICGASGFIGRNLWGRLIQRDDLEVYGTYFSEKFTGHPNLMQVDLTNRKQVDKLLSQGFDVLIQAAANTSGAKDVVERPYLHVTDNVVMNALIFQSAYDYAVPQIVFLSCTVMYPSSGQPIKEDTLDLNAPMYEKYFGGGWMKVYIEKLCEFYSRLGRNKFTVIRHSNIYGPHDRFNLDKSHVFSATITKVMTADDKIVVWGEGKEVRDLLYVSDLVDFVEMVIDKQDDRFNLFNVGLGLGISVAELVQKIVHHSGKKLMVEYDKTKPTIATKIVLDTTKAKEKFGWEPKVGLDEGIKKTLDWYRVNIQN